MDSLFITSKASRDDTRFDLAVGAIEDAMMDPEFQTLHTAFMTDNCHHFESGDENKFIYTTIHRAYVDLVEDFLMKRLTNAVPDFDMNWFADQAQRREDEMAGDAVELLGSLTDFLVFKDLILSFKDGSGGVDMGSLLVRSLRPQDDDDEAGACVEISIDGAGASMS